MANAEKVIIIGLAGAEPSLVFERWRDDLPNLRRLIDTGLHGTLESTLPPTAVPAWSCMASGKDPGTLGFYAEYNRRDWTYEDIGQVTNLEMRQPRLWDHITRAGKDWILLGVPQTFPMIRPPRGTLVTGPLTPDAGSPHTHPPELADELEHAAGRYIFDVPPGQHRADERLIKRLRRLDKQRFTVARHLMTHRDWDLLWMVTPGIDRAQRAFWDLMDPAHPRFEPDDPLADTVHDHYVHIDHLIGNLLKSVNLDDTAVCVVSEHGAARLDGAFALNDWLIRKGLLVMKSPAVEPRPFNLADVDWDQTKVWATGGACAMCHVNRRDREPRGIVGSAEYQALRDQLARELEQLSGPAGQPMQNRAFKPERIFDQLHGVAPDLFVSFNNLHWRCLDTVGHDGPFVTDDPQHTDAVNESLHGLYVLAHNALPSQRCEARVFDILPSVLEVLGLPIPRGLRGRSLLMQ